MEVIREFIRELKIRRYSPNTIESYLSDLKQFFSTINKKPEEITAEDILSYIDSLEDFKASSINRKLATFKAFFKFLKDKSQISSNPASNLKRIKQKDTLPKYLTLEEVLDIINKPKNKRHQLILNLLFYTGLRVSELINIRVKDINLNDMLIKVMGKGRRERVVPIPSKIGELVKMFVTNKAPEEYLLSNSNRPITRRAVYNIVKKYSGGKATPHVMRHTCATQLVLNGANIKLVQELLGHKNINTTMIYTKLTPRDVVEQYMKHMPAV